MIGVDDLKQNLLLSALPDADLQRWLPLVEAVEMPLGQVLWESGTSTGHVYFPTTAVCSLFGATPGKIAIVGREGLVGVSVLMTDASLPSRTIVQSAGRGFRLSAKTVLGEFERGGDVMRVLLRYLQTLFAQIVQTAGCNRVHSLDQRVCRLLLLTMDRLQSSQLEAPEGLISDMLGTSAASAIQSVLDLQTAGLVRYERGHITVLSRSGLEQRTCECYVAVKRDYDQRLPAALMV
jgi:hypothetical protein